MVAHTEILIFCTPRAAKAEYQVQELITRVAKLQRWLNSQPSASALPGSGSLCKLLSLPSPVGFTPHGFISQKHSPKSSCTLISVSELAFQGSPHHTGQKVVSARRIQIPASGTRRGRGERTWVWSWISWSWHRLLSVPETPCSYIFPQLVIPGLAQRLSPTTDCKSPHTHLCPVRLSPQSVSFAPQS